MVSEAIILLQESLKLTKVARSLKAHLSDAKTKDYPIAMWLFVDPGDVKP
jgi:hypothetical protein